LLLTKVATRENRVGRNRVINHEMKSIVIRRRSRDR